MAENENIALRRFAERGDSEAFAELVREHSGLVYGTCLRILGDQNLAADATQETFFQLLRNARTISGSVSSWLFAKKASSLSSPAPSCRPSSFLRGFTFRRGSRISRICSIPRLRKNFSRSIRLFSAAIFPMTRCSS